MLIAEKELSRQGIRGVRLSARCASWALTFVPPGVVSVLQKHSISQKNAQRFPSLCDSTKLQIEVATRGVWFTGQHLIKHRGNVMTTR